MNKVKIFLGLLLTGCLATSPVIGQQARQMTRATTGFGDSSLVVTSDTLTSKTTFVTKAVSLSQIRKSLSKFSFDSMSSTGPFRALGTSFHTGIATFTAQPIFSSLTASQAVFTDGSKGLVSNAITGSGNVVMSASPTLTGTTTLGAATFGGAVSGITTLAGSGAISGFTTIALGTNPAAAGIVKIANNQGIQARNAANSADINIAFIDGSNILQLGASAGAAFAGPVSGITTLAGTGAVSGFTTANFSDKIVAGINGTSGYRLRQSGGSEASFVVMNASNKFIIDESAFGVIFQGAVSATAIPAEGSTQSALCITAGGAIQQNAAATCTVSARRFKHDIVPLSLFDAQNIAFRLRAVTYTENASSRRAIGVIAEEADSVDHRLATRDAKGQITSVNYEEITIALLRTVQDQAAQIKDLQARLAKLEKH
jgi:hypothetical protein